MSTDVRQPSTFGCVFCEFEDEPMLLKAHLIEEHAVEIAGQHWATHVHRVEEAGR